MSCLPSQHPSSFSFSPRVYLYTQNWPSWACLVALFLLWPWRQTASVPFHFTLSGLYMEHRGCDCPPVQAPDRNAEWASRLVSWPPTFHSLMYFMQAGGKARVWVEWGKGIQRGSRLVQDVIILCPDITELSLTQMGLLCLVCQLAFLYFLSYTAEQQAHTLQAGMHWPEAPGATMRGWLTCMCVCLSLSFYVGKCVSVLVEAGPWELKVGASWLQQWLLPWQPRRKRCVEWVSGRGIHCRCMCAGDVVLFMNLVI